MYLAEEGDGTVAGASTNRLAGLLKVTLVDGKWEWFMPCKRD